MPEKFVNDAFTLKTHQIFPSTVYPAEKFKNPTITGQFGFVINENPGREIATLSRCRYFSESSVFRPYWAAGDFQIPPI